MNEKFYQRMFFVGALWNVLGGAFIIAFAGWIFASAHVPAPAPPLYFQSWVALFVVFGFGYYLVSRDLDGNRNIALLGAIGKLAFSFVFIGNVIAFRGQVPSLFWIPVIGDLIFAALFVMFLRSRASS